MKDGNQSRYASDEDILTLYNRRDEQAIAATQSCIQNLYVACTRAKEVLYIIAPEAENESVFIKMLKDSI